MNEMNLFQMQLEFERNKLRAELQQREIEHREQVQKIVSTASQFVMGLHMALVTGIMKRGLEE
jgi:hypothetical protein